MKECKQYKESSLRAILPKRERKSFYLVDNRSHTIVQRRLIETIQAKNEENFLFSSCIAQRMSYATSNNPDHTKQWEGRGTPWKGAGRERSTSVAGKVDQFKKDMLTYIAYNISSRQQNQNYYNPHIAVIIAGDNWSVSVNSDLSAGKQAELQVDANQTKAHIGRCWASLNTIYDQDYFKKSSFSGLWHSFKWLFQGPEEEATYIAFRWAANKANVVCVNNPIVGTRRDKRIVHGEMRIINHLQGAGAIRNTDDHKGPLRRVVRVGGTKTPCLDCGWEMGKVTGLDQAAINVNTESVLGHETHGVLPGASLVGVGDTARVVTTMSPKVGKGFSTWQSPDNNRNKRVNELIPDIHDVPDYDDHQNQNYNALKQAYIATGSSENMI